MRTSLFLTTICLSFLAAAKSEPANETVQIKPFSMPTYSAYLRQETVEGMKKEHQMWQQAFEICNPYEQKTTQSIRDCEAKIYPPIVSQAKQKYAVKIESAQIAGVPVDIVTPKAGLAKDNQDRVLINLHGGGFKYGGKYAGQLESMPIAHYGRFKVIAIDYKKAPEYRFPAANKDAEQVYRELLKDYPAANIGLFGCSAGSRLVGESIVWFAQRQLPSPGAAAMLCSAPTGLDGDSNYIAAAIKNRPVLTIAAVEYWQGLSADNAMAFPGDHPEKLQLFPPSLLITSTRDYSLSPVVNMHANLVRLGIPAQLHVFEGFEHGGFLSMHVPESKETAKIVSSFFARHLD